MPNLELDCYNCGTTNTAAVSGSEWRACGSCGKQIYFKVGGKGVRPARAAVGHCPKCQFKYAWDGQRCNHCKFVSGARAVQVVAGAGAAVLALGVQAKSVAAPAAAASAAPLAVASAVVPPADAAASAAGAGADGGSEIVDAIGEFLGEVFKGLLGG